MRRARPLLIVVLLLAACETGPLNPVLVPAGPVAVGRMQLRTDTIWTRLPAKPPLQVWTAYGPLLDQLLLHDGLADGQPLVDTAEGRPRPLFRAALTGPELAEFLLDSLRASGAVDAALLGVRPQPFAGGEGIRAEFRYRQPESGLAMRGVAAARVRDGRLVLIQLVAAEDHYFPALLPAFEQLVASAVIA
ncbi:MAG: hypothetical protein N3D77_14425 [Geminicoccaceae bacterium]|nr:hypothetical protein [Geminicoccaceae bacterium]